MHTLNEPSLFCFCCNASNRKDPSKVSEKIFQNFGMFLAHHRTVVNRPQFTTNPPQLHHKNTTQKTHIFQNHPQKTPANRQKKAPANAGTFFPTKSKN